MNAKDDEKQKRVDPFSDSKELFAKIFKEAIREIELERRGKKQAAASRISTSSGGSQRHRKMPAKEKSALPPIESAQRKSETTRAGPESKPKSSELTLPPKSAPKSDKKGGRRSVAPMVAVLLVLVVIVGGTVSSYMGIIDISFLLNYFGSGRKQTTQPLIPIRQPVKASEKAVPSLSQPQEQTPTPSSVLNPPSPSVLSKEEKLVESESPITITQPKDAEARVEEQAPSVHTTNQPGPPDVAAKEERQTVSAQIQPAAKPAAPEVASLQAPPPQYPYSVYLGSFKTERAVNKALTEYQEKGLSVYWARVDLGDKGVWFRFFTGYFRNKEEAEKFIKDRNIQEATPGTTKYANFIGSYESDKEIDARKQALVSAGFYPYTIIGIDGKSLIYSGAFYRKDYAEKEKNALSSKGIASEVVER
jgi:cell division septation protein DedD